MRNLFKLPGGEYIFVTSIQMRLLYAIKILVSR